MAYTTIKKPSDYFNTKLYTGTGSSNAITGVGFQPDFTIVKRRDNTGVWYNTDIVRGAGKQMYLNETGGMGASASTTEITGFNSDGFNLGTDIGVNASGGTYVSYNFLANNTIGSSNTDGDITSTVSENTTAGFSIVKYTGNGLNDQRIGHGLGARPVCWMIKRLDSSGDWVVYHQGIASNWYDDTYLYLNSTNAVMGAVNTGTGNPTSSVFYIGNDAITGASGGEYIAYVFAEKQGFSKFGSYTGNGNADGTFVYTGFKPAFVLVKRYSAIEQWQMTDSVRDKDVSPNFARLNPDTSSAESTNTTWAKIEKFSNGFKLGGTDTVSNGSGSNYIYMAFAEEPLVGDNPATAR